MRYRLPVLMAVLASVVCHAQDFSNKGKDFWVGYGFHARMNNVANSQNMVLYFTSDVNANVKVEIPLLGYSATYKVTANTVTESSPLPKSGAQDARLIQEGISNAGIHITADAPVVAYAHIYDGSVSGASLLFPTNTLGQDYYTLGYTQVSNEDKSNAFAFVIATEDNTTVEITPAAATATHQANVPFTVSLSKGQIYNVMGSLTGGGGTAFTGVDLTGSRIRSVSTGSNSCKKIAVFSGSGKISIACDPNGNASADNLIQQMFPSTAWGKKYLTVPTRFMVFNYYRVMVKDPSTQVKLNGVPLVNLLNGRYYEFTSTGANVIEADKPVQVAQYMTTSFNCGNTVLGTNGDPEMICLSPVEQTISDITLNSTSKYAIKYHYINVVIPTTKVSSFKLDGVTQAAQFSAHPTASGYSWAQLSVASGSHHLRADTGFTAIAYGMGSFESYGYNAGANVVDLYQSIKANNVSTGYALPVTCRNEQFNFSVTVPYQPTQITWDFYNNSNLKDPQAVLDPNPVSDSIYTKEGRTLYRYTMKTTLSYNGTGVLPIRVFLNNPTADGCSGIQQIDYEMTIVEKPKADLTLSFADCQKSQASFADASTGYERTLTSWAWNFSDGYTSTAKQFSKTFAAPGTYTAVLKVGNDIGCYDDTTVTIKTGELPKAQFIVNSNVCSDQKIELKNTSTGSILQHIWITDNGKADTLTSAASYFVKFSGGNHTVKLITIADGVCKDSVEKTITVSAGPKAAFSAPTSCIGGGNVQFADSSSVSTGTIAKYEWNFGDANAPASDNISSQKNPSHSYSKQGSYTVQLIVTSDKGCVDTTTQTISPNELPKADFETVNAMCAGTLQLKNTSTGSIANYVWIIDNNKRDTLTTSASYQINLTTAGDHAVKLITLANGGCKDSVEKKITINPFPKAAFVAPSSCAGGGSIKFTDSSYFAGGTGAIVKYEWNFGDANATSADNNSTLSNPSHNYTKQGSYSVQLIVTSDKGCTDTIVKTVSVSAGLPKASFEILNTGKLCAGTEIQLKNNSGIEFGSIVKTEIVWDATNTETDSSPAAGKIYKHNYPVFNSPASKQQTIKLRAYAGDACMSETTVDISLYAKPQLQFDSVPAFCNDGSVKQLVAAETAGNAGTFVFSGSGVSGTGLFDSKTAGIGSHMIRYIYTTADGCTDSLQRNIQVVAVPKAVWNYSAACGDQPITFNDLSTSAASIVSRVWSFSDGSTMQTNDQTFTKPLNFTSGLSASLTVTDNNGCKSEVNTQQITMQAKPIVDFSLPIMLCLPNATANFKDLSSIADHSESSFTYLWNFGDAGSASNTSVMKNPSHDYSTKGPKTITLTVTSSNGCSSSATRMIADIYAQPHAAFSVNKDQLCVKDQLTVADSSTNMNGTVAQYYWNFGNGNTSSAGRGTTAFSAEGNYTVTYHFTDEKGCMSDTATKMIRVNGLPSVDAGTDQMIPEGASVKLTPIVSGNIVKHIWSGMYLNTDSALTVISTPLKDQTYRLTVTGEGGCMASDEVTVKLMLKIRIPNVFSPNGDGIHDQWIIDNLSNYSECTVEVFDRYGTPVFGSKGYEKPWDGTYKGKPLPYGTYYYIIDTKRGSSKFTGYITILR